MKMVDYVVDGGEMEEEICDTKQQAIKRAQEIANDKNEPIRIYRWYRPDRDRDLEIDEGFDLVIKPERKENL